MKSGAWRLGALLALAALSGRVEAHDARPAYLEIQETAPDRFQLLWRTPVLGGMPLPVALRLPESLHTAGEPVTQRLVDSVIERRVIVVSGDELTGARIEFVGLQATITDVLVRVDRLDGGRASELVGPSQPWVEIPGAQGWPAIAASYLLHGIEHILLGFDHLLFVLALTLIVRRTRVLVWTITAFTVAHSITLALATLGVVVVPGAPVEAVIALSILLLACEIMRLRRGDPSATAEWPWVVAFSFGLLHGFGFAGALTDLGLPQGDIPLALFAFNVGVELGQLAFIGTVLGLLALARRTRSLAALEGFALPASAYGIGILAAFWFFERLARIL